MTGSTCNLIITTRVLGRGSCILDPVERQSMDDRSTDYVKTVTKTVHDPDTTLGQRRHTLAQCCIRIDT